MTYLSRMFLAPRSTGGAPLPNPWYDPNGEGLCVWEAWLAKGAADYATSLLGLANGRNLSEGNGAISWNAATGWSFTIAAAQWLDTGGQPAADWTMMVQFANSIGGLNFCVLAGVFAGAGDRMSLIQNTGAAGSSAYANGNVNISAYHAAGNMALAGKNCYFNGGADGVIAAGGTVPAQNVLIGRRNGVAPNGYYQGDIIAFVLYNCTITAPQVLAVATAMAAL